MDFWGFLDKIRTVFSLKWDGVLEMCAKESFEAEQDINGDGDGDGDGDSQLETSLLKEIFCRYLAKKRREIFPAKIS